MEQAKAAVSLLLRYPSTASAAGCSMGMTGRCPYRSTLRQQRGRSACSARSSSSLRHAPSVARVYAAAAATTTPEPNTKEKDLVFIGGATGKVGSRAVRELIKLGFRVRAGVRSAQRASPLVQSVEQLKLDGATAASPAEKLEIVECDLEKQAQDGIVSAIGNAAIVVCSIGASEKDILDVTGPYRIDYMATNNLVKAATAAKVEHFILVTSLGTNKIGFPAFLLNLFWGVLCWKRRSEEALISSGLPYTIVRPGGMERPTDAFKETHNLVVAAEDTYVGGLVSNLQVAELIGCMASNRAAAYCKVVEVVAETTAPLLPMEDLLARIPSKREPPPLFELEPEKDEKELNNEETAQARVPRAEQQPLSPYKAFVDLKPPSSPSPSPPAAPAPTSPNTTAASSSAELDSNAKGTSDQLKQQQRPLSPYTRYEELKPPSSPSPSPPATVAAAAPAAPTSPDTVTAASSSMGLDTGANGSPVSGDRLNQQQKPLSPYTRYEELKPPSSPTPSAPKL